MTTSLWSSTLSMYVISRSTCDHCLQAFSCIVDEVSRTAVLREGFAVGDALPP